MQAADVWSLGVMVFACVAADYPFGSPSDGEDPTRAVKLMLQVSVNVFFLALCLSVRGVLARKSLPLRLTQ